MILSLKEFQELRKWSDDLTLDMGGELSEDEKETGVRNPQNIITGYMYPGNYRILKTERDSWVYLVDDYDDESESIEYLEEKIYWSLYIKNVQEVEIEDSFRLGDDTLILSPHELNEELQSLTSGINLLIQTHNNEMNDSNKEGFDYIGFTSGILSSLEDEMIRLGYRTRV